MRIVSAFQYQLYEVSGKDAGVVAYLKFSSLHKSNKHQRSFFSNRQSALTALNPMKEQTSQYILLHKILSKAELENY